MVAMALFNEGKSEYEALAQQPDPDGALRSALHSKFGAKVLDLAIKHGGVYIKACQFVASLQGGAGDARIPREYIDALRPLTDRVPPRAYEEVAAVAEAELGRPLEQAVVSLERLPVAAASLAQVHRAALTDGTRIALKLQYPGLREQMASDFETLRMMCMMSKPLGYDVSWVVEDIEKYVTSELDFTREAENAAAAAAALSPLSPGVLVPLPVLSLCRPRVLATVFAEGLLRLDAPAALEQHRIDRRRLGVLIARAFAELPLVHGLVHGDPHAGNVYARRQADGSTGLVILDHGLYHRLTHGDRLAFCDLVLACATPWASRRATRALASRFAPGLEPLFPVLLSPSFALATGLSSRELRAAAAGKLPEGVTLEDVWRALVALHAGESDVLGTQAATRTCSHLRARRGRLRTAGASRQAYCTQWATCAGCRTRWARPSRPASWHWRSPRGAPRAPRGWGRRSTRRASGSRSA